MISILTILFTAFVLITCTMFILISIELFKDSEKNLIDRIFLFLTNAGISIIIIATIIFFIVKLFL